MSLLRALLSQRLVQKSLKWTEVFQEETIIPNFSLPDHISLSIQVKTVKIGVTAVSKALENFWVPNNPEGVKGLKPTGVYLKTAGTETYTRRDNGYGGTVAWDQPAGDTVVTFAVRSKNNALVKRDLRVTVLELTKKLDAVPGEKVEVSDLKNISEDEKNKIIEATKKSKCKFPSRHFI